MTSFDTAPIPHALWRVLLALVVVLVLLMTTGWTAVRLGGEAQEPREAALAAWRHDRIGLRPLPDPSERPAAISAFFGSLNGKERGRLAVKHPFVVGNLDGAPIDLRYRANRIALRGALDAERDRVADRRLSEDGHRDAVRRTHRFEALLGKDRRILAFDPTGRGRVAEVFGDLRRAERVSVVVPGVDTNLLTFQKTSLKYTAPVGMARSLYQAERETSPTTRTAVIAWADYASPAGVGMDAATGRLAATGADRLATLTEGLPGKSKVALFCHSYGSVVCGVAARRLPDRVTDIAVAGSPGMRADNVAGLGTRARVWAARDADDWIADVPYLEVGGLGHGADPVEPEFGARLVSSTDAAGHAGYFVPGTDSLRNFAGIGVGAYGQVRCAPGEGSCRDDLPLSDPLHEGSSGTVET
ncbi:alpha/beta hydrolase [Streptomyces sp. NPDC046887]|uniref:alpha/beta hydrolase n=1 Tax=Streptomyces sp. NPDC046887 TaxID=3155472 RepID=UPI0033C62E7E